MTPRKAPPAPKTIWFVATLAGVPLYSTTKKPALPKCLGYVYKYALVETKLCPPKPRKGAAAK